VISATRSIKEQHGLYIQAYDGKDNDGDKKIDEPDELVTKADGGQSAHNFGMGCDCAPLLANGDVWWKAPTELWNIYGRIIEELGLTWGGHFKSIYDAPHIEDPRWHDRQAAYKAGKIQVA
jgi:peptidoglycan L-alanyl-D-glutamate endopeptidase CwlK